MARMQSTIARALIAAAALVMACGSGAQQAQTAPPTTGPTPPAGGGQGASKLAVAATYQNPVVRDNCPDPGVIEAEGAFYAVCTTNTNTSPDKFPIRRSTDLVHWEPVGFVFPTGRTPAWARADYWAPEIHRIGNRYVAYFTARHQDGKLSIGVATAEHPGGPYTDAGQPLIHDTRAGMIDSNHFQDQDGKHYLYWKIDGNDFRPPEPTNVFVQELSPDGMSLLGTRRAILTNDRPWEGEVIEGGWLLRRGDYYYMFYSGNTFNSDRYAAGIARSRSPLGPFEKLPDAILRSSERWAGPGHGSVIHVGDADWYVYHAWERGRIDPAWDKPMYPRMMLIDRVQWGDDGWPRFKDGRPSEGSVSTR